MIKAKGKFSTSLGMAFCFFAAVLLAVAAMNIGFMTEPGKILPVAISMRSGETNKNILRGIDLALDDISLIRSGESVDTWRLLTFVHADLFFYLALIVPEALAKTILLIGYYLRFGLCCSAMYYFMSKHIRLSRLPSAMLAAMYAFSSQIIFTAQFPSVMNMAIMFPVLLSAFDSYLQKRTWKTYTIVCVCSFGMAFTGGFAIIAGIPAMALIGLVMCIGLYSRSGRAVSSWFKLVSGLSVGLLLDMAFLVPGLTSMESKLNIAASFSDSKVTYTVYDLLRGTLALRSGSMYDNGSPLFYIGILTIAAVVAFALNEQIPVRLKAASAVIAAVMHIAGCSSFVNDVLSFFGSAPVLTSARLICLEVLIFFMAAIGLKNVKSLKKGGFIAVCLVPLAFLVLSNNSSAGTSFSSSIIVSTFVVTFFESLLVYALARNKLSSAAKYAVLFAAFILVGVNTAFVMFNNTISSSSASEYFKGNRLTYSEESLITDNGFALPAVCDDSTYIVIPADLSVYESAGYALDSINYLSYKTTGEDLFERADYEPDSRSGMLSAGMDLYVIKEGYNELVMIPPDISSGDRMFVYCSSPAGASVRIENSDGMSERIFEGPFLTEIYTDSDDIAVNISLTSESERTCRVSLVVLKESVYESMQSLSGEVSGSAFKVNINGANRARGTNTLILPYAYDEGTRVRINGTAYDTYDICGKMALTFECGDNETVDVKIGKQAEGTLAANMVSAFMALCLVAIPLIQRYNDKKKVTGEGNNTNA